MTEAFRGYENRVVGVINYIFNRDFKKYFEFADDIFLAGYTSYLERKKEIDSLPEGKDKTQLLFSSCRSGMRNFVRNFVLSNIVPISSFDISQELEDFYFSIDNTFNEILGQNLLDLFNEFCKRYDDKESLLLKDYFLNNVAPSKLLKKYKIQLKKILLLIKAFKPAFAEFLVSVGYVDNVNTLLSEDKNFKSLAQKRFKDKQGGLSIDYSLYANDYFIYKLLRKEKDLTKFAESLNSTTDKVNTIIFHKKRGANTRLKMYEVQILRKKFFPSYSLQELVSCDG